MATEFTHFIDGKAVPGKSGRTSDVFNPATGELGGKLPLATRAEVDAAVQSAKAAFPAWAKTPPLSRARVMFKYKELLEKNRDKLAQMIGREHGKVLADATGEVTRGIEVVEFVCGIPHLLKGEFTENVGTNVDSHSVRPLTRWPRGAVLPERSPLRGARVRPFLNKREKRPLVF